MIRAVIALAALTLGAGVVLAQQDAAAQRQALMKANGKNVYGVLGRMVKGTNPYDQAAVDGALNQLDDTAKKLPGLFPDGNKASVSGSEFSTSPKAWDNKADLNAHVQKFGAAVIQAKAKVKDLDSLKAEYPAINATCNSCHEVYRVKN